MDIIGMAKTKRDVARDYATKQQVSQIRQVPEIEEADKGKFLHAGDEGPDWNGLEVWEGGQY